MKEMRDALRVLSVMFPLGELCEVRLEAEWRPPATMYPRTEVQSAQGVDAAVERARQLIYEENKEAHVLVGPSQPLNDRAQPARLHALWMRIPQHSLEASPVSLAPSLIVSAPGDGSWWFAWAAIDPLTPDQYEELSDAMSAEWGGRWQAVLTDGRVPLPGSPVWPHDPRQAVAELRVATDIRYSTAQLRGAAGLPDLAQFQVHAIDPADPDRDRVPPSPASGDAALNNSPGLPPDSVRARAHAQPEDPSSPCPPESTGDLLASSIEPDAPRNDAPDAASASAAECIARSPNILQLVRDDLLKAGFAGDPRVALLVFLAVVSRLLDRPVSLAIKGQSSSGKNATVDAALRFFPDDAYFARTSLTDKALFYSSEPFEHRMLVLYEGHKLKEGDLAGIVRGLLSEGRLVHEVTDIEHFTTRVLEKDGPTGLITTTTLVTLDRELETRILSPRVSDDADLTRAILLAQADAELGDSDAPDYTPWQQFNQELAAVEAAPVVPFARELAELVDVTAVRMRRDHRALITLVKAHALLHEATRSRDDRGRIGATIEDYAAVHALIADVLSEGVALTVAPLVRTTVEAARRALSGQAKDDLTIRELADALSVHESNARRRAYECFSAGYLSNRSAPGRPMRITLAEALPEDREVLPTPDQLREACASARTMP